MGKGNNQRSNKEAKKPKKEKPKDIPVVKSFVAKKAYDTPGKKSSS